ncbi:MAG: hypothetical protein RIS45_946 [Planctomycetota bacterium]
MPHTDIAIPPRHLATVCRLFGCAVEDALDRLCALEMNDAADLLHPSGAIVTLEVALPFKAGIAFRVAGIRQPELQAAPVAAARVHRPISAWLGDVSAVRA